MGKVADRLSSPSASLLEDMALLCPAMRGLFALTADFAKAYDAEKKKRAPCWIFLIWSMTPSASW
ncbi:MAG: hypothetical protein ACLUNZ_13115 [Evtepia sp.]